MSIAAQQQDAKFRLKAIEHNVMQRFSEELKSRFPVGLTEFDQKNYAGTSLGGQDQVFADYLLAANARFALIEFKASFSDIRSETEKALRHALFERLAIREDMLLRCLDLHYICWGTTSSFFIPGLDQQAIKEEQLLSQYAPRVAPYMPCKPRLPVAESYGLVAFLDDFLGSHLVGGNIQRFNTYIGELAALAKGKKGDDTNIQGMVCVFVPADGRRPAEYAHLRFVGIEGLLRLLSYESPNHEHVKKAEYGQEFGHRPGI